MEPATWVAIVVALLGGVGVKVAERWLNRNQIEEDSGLKLRTELRTELTRLRTDLEKTQEELEEYRGKYFKLLEEFSKAKIDLQEALYKIQKQAEVAQNAVNNAPPPAE